MIDRVSKQYVISKYIRAPLRFSTTIFYSTGDQTIVSPWLRDPEPGINYTIAPTSRSNRPMVFSKVRRHPIYTRSHKKPCSFHQSILPK